VNFWPSTCQQYLVPLKHTCRMNPEVLAESTDPDFEMEYIDIGNVSLEHGIGQLQPFRFHAAPRRARKIVRKGDTLISTVRTYLKAVAYVQEDHTNWIASTGFAILRPDVGIDPRFLYRVTQASPFVAAVVASSTGVSYPAINPSTLGSIAIPLPDLKTQKAIADFLDCESARIDQLIEKKQRMVELTLERQAVRLDRMTFNAPENKNWSRIPFKWICRIPSGQVDPKEDSWADLPLIAPNHIESRTGRLLLVETARDQAAESGKYTFPVGTALYSKIRPALAKACIAPERGLCSADMYPIIPSSRLLPAYLLMQLLSETFTDWAVLESMRVAMPKINREALGAFRLLVPPIKAQHAMVQIWAIGPHLT
jgi:type I restriction enzyme S subunit